MDENSKEGKRKGEEGERKGRGKERRGEERGGEARTGKEKKGDQEGEMGMPVATGGGFFNLKAGETPPGHKPENLFRTRTSSEPTFFDVNFRIDF